MLGATQTVSSPAWDGGIHRAELRGPGLAIAVADGLGGHAHGELASATAVSLLIERLADETEVDRLASTLRESFDQANLALIEGRLRRSAGQCEGLDPPAGRGESDDGRPLSARILGAQTTLTALVLAGGRGHLAHVGDCRAFRLRDGTLELLTTDHTQAMELVRMRLIRAEQAARHPGRHLLTRSLGGDVVLRVDVRAPEPAAGDAYLLASDGLWSAVTAVEVREALEGDLGAGLEALLSSALERGGDDNASVIAVRVLDPGARSDAGSPGWRSAWRRTTTR
ncbi:MAG TPA: protein phosphatase 2C domain-containing protein [Candidatus Dormibacteraeota bacterium]|nr:protein phosphatase 2C domain-containing protein [Candidatus Dormibacteraeota bacterium]